MQRGNEKGPSRGQIYSFLYTLPLIVGTVLLLYLTKQIWKVLLVMLFLALRITQITPIDT